MLRYDVVDVFTDRPFAGNQLAVVHDAAGLSDEQMLALTREFAFSETAFPSPLSPSAYAVRIFTPGGELPFAGHPTLGTAWVLRRSGALAAAEVTQSCLVGEIRVRFDDPLVTLTAGARDLAPCPSEVTEELLADLGLVAADLAGAAWLAGTGLTFVHLPVSDVAVVRARVPTRPLTSYDALHSLGNSDRVEGVNLYAYASGSVHSRVFAPGLSVPEDPATGSAAAGLGLALVASGALPGGGSYLISQGREMGRPSTLHCRVTAVDGVAIEVEVAGGVHAVASGTIAVPPT